MSRIEFPKSVRQRAYTRSGGCCENCAGQFGGGNGPEYDHVKESYLGGESTLENCRVLCRNCHGAKTAENRPEIDRTRRLYEKHNGIRQPKKSRPIPGTKASGLKKRFDGSVVRR